MVNLCCLVIFNLTHISVSMKIQVEGLLHRVTGPSRGKAVKAEEGEKGGNVKRKSQWHSLCGD